MGCHMCLKLQFIYVFLGVWWRGAGGGEGGGGGGGGGEGMQTAKTFTK